MSISFDCQPHNETPNLEAFYAMYLEKNKLTLRPAYQRNACWDDRQKSALIDTIMGLCPMPPFLIYKYDEDMECIDGQNRLTTIKEYKEQEPNDLKKPFAWIIQLDDKTEYVYYKSSPAFEQYVTEMNKKKKSKGKEYRFMTNAEMSRFNDYGLVAQMIKTKLTFDQRKAIFQKWQNGSSISQCDALKNQDTPFCNWVVSDGIEGRLGKPISLYLKSGSQNWLFDVVRLLRVFLSKDNGPAYSIISTLQSRSEMAKKEFDKAAFDEAAKKLEKFLDAIKPLKTLSKTMKISFLLGYAYIWYTMEDTKRNVLEDEAFMLQHATVSLANKDANHSTLNNGPAVKSFLDQFDNFKQNINIDISKNTIHHLPLPYKKATISSSLKKQVWEKYNEKLGEAKCHCCGIINVSPLNYEAGHVIPEITGGKTIVDNLRPICKECNRRMGATNMRDWMITQFPSRKFV